MSKHRLAAIVVAIVAILVASAFGVVNAIEWKQVNFRTTATLVAKQAPVVEVSGIYYEDDGATYQIDEIIIAPTTFSRGEDLFDFLPRREFIIKNTHTADLVMMQPCYAPIVDPEATGGGGYSPGLGIIIGTPQAFDVVEAEQVVREVAPSSGQVVGVFGVDLYNRYTGKFLGNACSGYGVVIKAGEEVLAKPFAGLYTDKAPIKPIRLTREGEFDLFYGRALAP